MKKAPLIFAISLLITAGVAAGVAPKRNPAFEFCTTKAYGYPMPWRVDNCLCDGEGGRTEYPAVHAAANLGAVGVVAGLLGGIVLRLRRKPEGEDGEE